MNYKINILETSKYYSELRDYSEAASSDVRSETVRISIVYATTNLNHFE